MSSHSMDNLNHKRQDHSYTKKGYQTPTIVEYYDINYIVAVVCYLTLFGWFIAIVFYGKHKCPFTSFHLRQSLGLIITASLLLFIPLIGWLMAIGVCIAWLYAFFYAVQGQQKKVFLLGNYYQEQLDFIK
ncbi:MAG: hypothetical protein QF552_08375 [Litorilituus sp.]|nr:hypothetical protein [Litorilituus sp.]